MQGGATRRSWLRPVVTAAVTVAVMAGLAVRFGGDDWPSVARGLRPGWVAFSFVVAAACLALGTVRWELVLRSTGNRVGFRRALVAVLASWPAALVTPSRAGDLLRPLAIRDLVPVAEGVGSVLCEKVIDLATTLALSAAGAALAGLWTVFAVTCAALCAELVVLAFVIRGRERLAGMRGLRRRAQVIRDLSNSLAALVRAPALLAAIMTVSIAVRLLTCGIVYALLIAADADVTLLDTCILWPVATIVGLLPLTLGGMGTRDAAFLFLLAQRGHSVARAAILAATMGYSAIALGAFALIGLPFMFGEVRRGRWSRAAERASPGFADGGPPDVRAPRG